MDFCVLLQLNTTRLFTQMIIAVVLLLSLFPAQSESQKVSMQSTPSSCSSTPFRIAINSIPTLTYGKQKFMKRVPARYCMSFFEPHFCLFCWSFHLCRQTLHTILCVNAILAKIHANPQARLKSGLGLHCLALHSRPPVSSLRVQELVWFGHKGHKSVRGFPHTWD